jgi:hypothetical protein
MSKQLVTGIAGLAVGAGIVLLALSAFKSKPGPRTLTIGIYKTASACEVDFPVAVVSLARKEKVAWQSQDADQDYTVIFQPSAQTSCNDSGTPFNKGTIYVPKAPASGSPPAPAGDIPINKGHYCYEVFKGNYTSTPAPSSALCEDPGLHVKD